MAQKIITQRVDLRLQDGCDRLEWPNVLAVKGDSYAHLWRVELYDGGAPASLTGHTAQCYVVNGQNTVLLTATIADNVVSVAFPSACYALAGDMKCLMSVMSMGRAPTVALLRLHVLDSITDVLIDPDDVVPSVSELMEIVSTLAAVADSEAARVAAETLRQTAEGLRAPAETARISAEQARASAEALRLSAETLRLSAESDRATAEAARGTAESARQAAESGRTGAETARGVAEAARAAAESQRQSDTATALAAAGSAASAADAAAGAANTAAGTAGAAASAATAAASAANAAAYEIDGMTIEVAVVPYGTTPLATVTEVDGHKHIALQVQQGPQGPGYTIKGSAYTTLAALQAAIPTPAIGDQYNVGSAAPYHVYRWTGAAWEDQGELQGPAGDEGYSPLASVGKLGNTATITITDKLGTTSAQVNDGTNGDNGVTFTPAVSTDGIISFTNDGGRSNPAPVDLVAPVAAAVPAVRYDAAMNLTALEKAQACSNAGALPAADVYNGLDASNAVTDALRALSAYKGYQLAQMLAGNTLIQTGTVGVVTSGGSSNRGNTVVTFPTPFASPPIMLAVANTTAPAARMATVNAPTATDATITAEYVGSTTAITINASWIAIGMRA